MQVITEKITAKKPVVAKGIEQVIITTESGLEIWARKSQFNDAAETVSYRAHKAGSEYTGSDGKPAKRKSDYNEYAGCGNISKSDSSKALLEMLLAKGITPVFSLS